MAHEPWLDCCSEDWVSEPRSSINSLPNGTPDKSRRSSNSGVQSRIPLAAPRSSLLPSNIHTRQPSISSLLDQAENEPASTKQHQLNSNSSVAASTDIRSPSSYSNCASENGTMQVKPCRGSVKNGTPEWKRRVIRGEISADEQCDLFGPLGLENVFKPPPAESRPVFEGFPKRNRIMSSKAPNTAMDPNGLVSGTCPRNDTLEPTPAGSAKESPAPPSIHKSSPSSNYNYTGLSKDDTRLRSVSGREELRNEGISPIFLTRNNTTKSQMDYAPLDEALGQLEARLGKSPLKDGRRRSCGGSDDGVYYDQDDQANQSMPNDNMLEMTCQSLPEDLSMGTQELGSNDAFASLRRAGYSNEASFQKQGLSPSSVPSRLLSSACLLNSHIPSSPPLPEYSQDSDAVPLAAPTPPQAPKTPHRTHSRSTRSPTAEKVSSGSPLKLFGNHDTFTNNKLLRRMSQFEETLPSDSDKESQSPSESRKGGNRDLKTQNYEKQQYIPGRRSEQKPVAGGVRTEFKNDTARHDAKANSVNVGKANSIPTDTLEESFEGSNSFPPLSSFLPTPNKVASRTHSRHNTRPLSSGKRTSTGKRENRQTQPTGGSQKRPYTQNQDSLINTSDAKRMLNTPARDSTPKRRRTLQRAAPSLAVHKDHSELTAKSNAALSFVTGQGQNSTQQYQEKESSQSDISKLPQERRPITPSPSRKKPSQCQDQVHNSQHDISRINRNSTNHVQTAISDDFPTPNHGATGATGVRKGSITTQDFLDEATKIMSIIRAKGRPKSALASVDESIAESQVDSDYGSIEESSSQEEFSRPPSREGVDIRKARVQPKQNPRIVSHLRKYQEKDDVDLLMSASIMSLHLDRGPKPAEKEAGVDQTQDEEEVIESSPKNIRIRENISHQRKRKHTTDSNGEEKDSASMNTGSSRSSSARSIPTGSSNSSGDKGIISSNMVAHLIPEQIGAMTYDRMNHTWIKGRGNEDASKTRSKSQLGSSEADPFEDITDLSVDELQDLMKAQKLDTRTNNDATSTETRMPVDGRSGADERPATAPQSSDSRPQTRDGNPSMPLDTSSVHSKISHFNFSGPKTETRATSWGTDDLESKPVQSSQATPGAYMASGLESLEQPLGSLSNTPRRANGPEKQSIAASATLSSHKTSRIEYENDSITGPQHRSIDADSATGYRDKFASYDQQPARSSHNPVFDTLPRRPFIGRPISRIDEQNEESMNQDLSVVRRNDQEPVVSIPPQNNELSIAFPPDSGPDTSYSFHLTTLADFTVNQIDQPLHLEVSYVAQRTHPTSLRQVHGTFALATEELVKHITDVEPYEPYWDHIRQLDLRGKGLITLHQLSEFCPRLEELDVSNNNIGQLSGIPSTIRNLNVQKNCLSSLTAWGHLSNLQYIDVSGNDLENLDGFSSLVHLRELKANDNKIENINGIFGLNGLLSVRLKGNSLASVDFEGAELGRLTDVDLSENQLSSVQNLHGLAALERLDLSGNNIQTLGLSAPHHKLRALKLSNNHMQDLDLCVFPALQLLYLDRNHFSTLRGLENCRHLEILSAREQVLPPSSRAGPHPDHVLDIDISSAISLRKLYLSSNILSTQTLSSPTTAPDLQLLDLASCAIKTLPAHFGTRFPNLRALNLNFNALSDVGELLGISRLGRLTLVGNRVARLRRLCQVLSRIGGSDGSLKKIDLRGNPVTVGFYPPAVSGSGRTIPKQTKKIENGKDRDRGDDGFLAITNLGHCADIAYPGAGVVDRIENRNSDQGPKGGVDVDEIDDPYTLPVADVEADKKYISRLDEGTRLRRKVVELMLSSATAGRVKLLDGLPLICDGSGSGSGSGNDCDNDLMLKKLKELQIFRERKRDAIEEEEL